MFINEVFQVCEEEFAFVCFVLAKSEYIKSLAKWQWIKNRIMMDI